MKVQILTWLFLLLLPGLVWASKNQDFFSVYDLEIDGKFNYHLVEDLNDDQKSDVILIHEGEEKRRMVSIFFQHDDGFHKKADQTWEIDNRVILFDTGNIDENPEKEIVCILKDGIYYYQFDNGQYNLSLHKLLDVNSLFVVPNKYRTYAWDFVRDLNDDNVDDLFIPFFDGYKIFYRIESGSYEFISNISTPVTGVITAVRQGTDNTGDYTAARYVTSTFLFKDYNQDGRSDIIAFDEKYLYIFFQDEAGRFSNEQDQHIKVSIIENKRGLTLSIGGKNEKEQVDISKISDINNDGLLDIIAIKMDTKASMLNPTSQLQIFLGKKSDTNSGASFNKTPDQIIVCEGLQIGSNIKDLNSDNNMDLIVPSIKLGVLKIIKMLLMRRATFEVLVYNADSQGMYSNKPDFETDLSIEFSYSGGSTIPVNDFNDYNGDGQTDILTSKSNEELNIYFGTGEDNFVNKKPDVKFKIELPKDGSNVKAKSLNSDNKMDLIISYNDQGNEQDTQKSFLKILIAK
jgi:hypothetical protein